jgi:hypothetical protein
MATRVNDGVVGQCDGMMYRRLNTVLPVLGKMDLGFLQFGQHRGLGKQILEISRSKDAIRVTDSASYGRNGRPNRVLNVVG